MATKASWNTQDTTGTSGWVPCAVVIFQIHSTSEKYTFLLVPVQCAHRPLTGYVDVGNY